MDALKNTHMELLWHAGDHLDDYTTTTTDAGATETVRRLLARLVTESDTARNIDSGKSFADYKWLCFIIDNNSSAVEGKAMIYPREIFQIFGENSGNAVDWADNTWFGVRWLSNTTFAKSGGGMGLRRIYGIKSEVAVPVAI